MHPALVSCFQTRQIKQGSHLVRSWLPHTISLSLPLSLSSTKSNYTYYLLLHDLHYIVSSLYFPKEKTTAITRIYHATLKAFPSQLPKTPPKLSPPKKIKEKGQHKQRHIWYTRVTINTLMTGSKSKGVAKYAPKIPFHTHPNWRTSALQEWVCREFERVYLATQISGKNNAMPCEWMTKIPPVKCKQRERWRALGYVNP